MNVVIEQPSDSCTEINLEMNQSTEKKRFKFNAKKKKTKVSPNERLNVSSPSTGYGDAVHAADKIGSKNFHKCTRVTIELRVQSVEENKKKS